MTGVLIFLLAAMLMGAPAQAKSLREEYPEVFEQVRHLTEYDEFCKFMNDESRAREEVAAWLEDCLAEKRDVKNCVKTAFFMLDVCKESEEL